MKEITKQEYDYVVNLFLTDSPYAKDTEDKKEIMKNFIIEFISLKSYLLENYKIYTPQEIIKVLKKYYNGKSYEEDKNGNIRIKTWINWKNYLPLKAELIFLDYISNKYEFSVIKKHTGIEFL
ncbi:hypothetical protein [Fusobacterium sp. FSA-380-WT-2B]|uniref:hypothetical protein n=1 Tax=Fusobacterium sp. FSA-380-WT-2B TaxID=2605786 RepID=UPI0012B43FD9|nr:hypothetical protein [Fusobacterium sp. FSA-380-WT-2B]MSS61441.1 hypothetical protein [Fusobacterium sp. FSA-380-WT-2B]